MDQSNGLVGVDYLSIFHPNNPPLVLGMLIGCVATDTSSIPELLTEKSQFSKLDS